MYKRILVPLDGSTLAEQVLPYVRILSKGLQLRVGLLRVIEPVPPELVNPGVGLYLDQLAASMLGEAQDYLEMVAVRLRETDLGVSCTVHEGRNPASYIVDEAGKDSATIIAISTHGRSGITRWLLGSVTDKVLHTTTNPLLIIRSRDGEAPSGDVIFDTIIVPLDGSPLAEQVLPHVASLAKALSLTVILTRVIPTEEISHSYLPLRELEILAEDYLRAVGTRLCQEGVSSVKETVLHGHPAATIVDLARDTSNNLVAMTTHGRSGIGRWILGSVTDRVVRYSGDPVLVVRATEHG